MVGSQIPPLTYTVRQAAQALNVSDAHVRNLIERGALPTVQGIGDVIRIPRQSIERMVHEATLTRSA